MLKPTDDEFDKTGFPVPEVNAPRLNYTRNLSPTILICGHGSRDTRCGILGPILRAEFNSCIRGDDALPYDWSEHDFWPSAPSGSAFQRLEPISPVHKTRVALTSHVGGHAFAGNVIIYLPKMFKLSNGETSPLGGMGIWYGRVEPRHVQGIVEETIKKGVVIEDLLRGTHIPGDLKE